MSDLDQMSRSIGHLEGNLKTLSQEVTRLMVQDRENLKGLYKKIDSIKDAMVTKEAIQDLTDDVEKLADDVAQLKNFKSKIVGGLIIVGTGAGIILAWIKGLLDHGQIIGKFHL